MSATGDTPPVPRIIDLRHVGRERVIGCWQVGQALVDPGPSSCLDTLLEALDGWRPRALLLTHIHLDHAGASGSLVARWPDLEVYVHERGARHMADPGRLLESARRLYGADMDRLWGEFLPVPEGNLRVLSGGERIEVQGTPGPFEVAYTPGHASHHVSYLHRGTAFVGDVGGVRIMPESLTIPPTPPPDIDLEAWHRSLDARTGLAARAAGLHPLRRGPGRRRSAPRAGGAAGRTGRFELVSRAGRTSSPACAERLRPARNRTAVRPTSRPRPPSSCMRG